MFKKDSIWLGIFMGLLLPAVFYGLLSLVAMGIETGPAWARPFEPDRMMLLSIFIDVVPIRLYFVSWKLDRTGRGVLISMFLLVIAFFIYTKYF